MLLYSIIDITCESFLGVNLQYPEVQKFLSDNGFVLTNNNDGTVNLKIKQKITAPEEGAWCCGMSEKDIAVFEQIKRIYPYAKEQPNNRTKPV